MTDKPFKVVHYSPVWLPLTETWLYSQVRHLPASIESHIVCRSVRNLHQFEVSNIHCLKRESPAGYLLHRALFLAGFRAGFAYFDKVAARIRPDLVHSHFGNNGWTVHKAVRRLGVPHVVTFYGQDVSRMPAVHPVWRERYREMFADEGTFYLCEGHAMAKALAGLGCAPERIRVQHLGVPVETIRYTPREWAPGTPLKVLIAASFHERKGIPYALEALARLNRVVPLEITVIGDAGASEESREEKRKILAVIERTNLGSATRMLGFQPHEVFWREAYANHIFLSPSITGRDGDTEGGAPVAIIELAASGMPIVSSRHCDIPEIVADGQTGWLAPERDVEALVDSLHACLAAAPCWASVLGAGRRRIETEYDAAIQGQRLGSIYRGLIAR